MNKKKNDNKKKNNNPSFLGVYISGLIFCLIVAALCTVQNSVPYSMRDTSIQLIDKNQILQDKLSFDMNEADYLLIYEVEDPVTINALEVICPVLEQTKISYDMYSTEEITADKLGSYKNIIIAVNHFQQMTSYLNDIKLWVYAGGNIMIMFPPEINGNLMSFSDVFGIKECGGYTEIEGVEILKDFLISGDRKEYSIVDPYESSLAVTLEPSCNIYLQSLDKYPVPLVWRNKYGEGNVVFDNFGIMGKAYRGIHCAALSLIEDSFVYPVINGAAFYIDDFPSPIPEGDGQYITRDYNMSIGEFYSQVWWNDVYDLAQRYDIKYTGLVIEEYSNQVTGVWKRNESTERYLYFGNMLLKSGGEIGVHGYNHMPLVLQNFDYKGEFDDYIQWPSENDMSNSLDELMGFTQQLFPEENIQVYVPPSNIVSDEAVSILSKKGINSVAAVYLPGEFVYVQEFDISEDTGIINTPRILSGYVFDDFMDFASLSELNFHYVSTHFQHPDDVLDIDRGAELGWKTMCSGLTEYVDWLYGAAPEIRNLTGSELAAAVERYDVVQIKREISDNQIVLSLSNYYDEVFMMLRLNNQQTIKDIDGADYQELGSGLYLLECKSDKVSISLN